MIDKTLYVYKQGESTIVSPRKPDCAYDRTMHRLIADDGCLLTQDDENYVFVIDVDSPAGWREVRMAEEPEEYGEDEEESNAD